MKKIIIAIDGYSSTGKSTLAKKLAYKLFYRFLDTGALYRAITFFALQKKVFHKELWEKEKFLDYLSEASIKIKLDQNKEAKFFLNDKELSEELRSVEVSQKVSLIASLPEVREKLLALQRNFGLPHKEVVVDGRDIGSVVFPEAELKLFFNASPEIRARRRHEEFLAKGQKISYEQVLENLDQRDHLDSTRELAPLSKASDAIEIDTTNLSKEETLNKVYELVLERVGLEKI